MDVFIVKTKLFFHVSLAILIWTNEYVREVSCGPDYMTQMKTVKDKLFFNYDTTIRPTNETNTTEIYTDFWPRQILSLDEEHAIFALDSYLAMSWFDPRLQWNKSDYEGYLLLPKHFVWLPDISIHNSHSLQVDPTQEVIIAVDSSGYVTWVPPLLTETSCPSLSQAPYPMDEVSCVIVFGSWMHDGWEINYQHNPVIFMDYFEDINPRWKLIQSSVFRNSTVFECCPEPYVSVEVTMTIKRRPVPEIEASRAPCILVMILTLCIFWLPPDSSHKLLLCGFLFVALNVLLAYVAYSTKYPLSILSAVSFLQTNMYLVVITILLQVFVVIKIGSLSGPSRPPPAIIQFLTGPLGKYTCLRSPLSEDRVSLYPMQLKDDSSTVENFSARDEWKLFATAIDRVLFVVMSVVMIAVHHL